MRISKEQLTFSQMLSPLFFLCAARNHLQLGSAVIRRLVNARPAAAIFQSQTTPLFSFHPLCFVCPARFGKAFARCLLLIWQLPIGTALPVLIPDAAVYALSRHMIFFLLHLPAHFIRFAHLRHLRSSLRLISSDSFHIRNLISSKLYILRFVF